MTRRWSRFYTARKSVFGFRLIIPLLALAWCSCTPATPDKADIARYLEGVKAFERGDFAEAAKVFEPLGKTRPSFLPARVMLGKSFFYRADYTSALSVFERLASDKPASLEARLWQARTLRSLGRENEARPILEELSGLCPGEPSLALERAGMLEKSGDLAGAIAACQEAVLRFTELGRAELTLARLYRAQGMDRQAREHLASALRILPPGHPLEKAAQAMTASLDRPPEQAAKTSEKPGNTHRNTKGSGS